MTDTELKARKGRFDIAVRMVLAILVTLGAGSSALAADGEWIIRLEPVFMEAYGHDQHVLTIHEIDLDATPEVDHKTAVTLTTDAGIAYRGEFQYTRKQWGLGLDFLWFNTSQTAEVADGASGTVDEVIFQIADQGFSSTDPSAVLYYNVLEDTDLAIWNVDAYAIRILAEKPESSIRLRFGLRIGDFDNDYRAAVGIRDIAGARLDASSNYDLMMGPLVGLVGHLHRGKNSIEAYLGQSVMFGSVELTSMSRQFTGSFGETPAFYAQEDFATIRDVAIPITELRIRWTYELGKHVALGVGANTSAWWDVPVPPGVIPVAGGDAALDENTIVFFGLLGSVELTF